MLKTDYNPDVLNCLANLSNDEVFTPPHIANQMLDRLPEKLWRDKNAKFLDPCCKSGVFLREITKRLIKGLAEEIPDLQTRVNHIMQHQVYGVAITELTALLSRRSLYCAKNTQSRHCVANIFENKNGNVAFEQIAHSWDSEGKCKDCGINNRLFAENNRQNLETHAYQFIHNNHNFNNMQFDVIIGNPPYQLSMGNKGGNESASVPIYQEFIKQAIKMQPNYLCMIVPSRWFAGGRGLDSFREEMLNDKRLKEINDFYNAADVFPGIDISGGVNYFLWDKNYQGDCLVQTYDKNQCISKMLRPLKEKNVDIFIRHNLGIPILRKVKNFNELSFSLLVSNQRPFGLATNFKQYEVENFKGAINLYTSKGKFYVNKNLINKNINWIDEYKVYISKAYGERVSENFWVTAKPFYGEPNSCCTQTYLVIGNFTTKKECENVMSYIKTRFFRFLVFLIKNTQDAPKKVYQFVPQQNFNEEWNDEKLYKKYGLTQDEIAFIEKMIRPMD